ncbi:MAG TPA: tetratricopeptide repeat protein [Vulgatibacter sp.]|nr:tetratricopeptide repeat protein [Vulgatibacter sp.]
MSTAPAPTTPLSERPLALLALALLAVPVAYSAAPLGGFVWDDVPLIVDSPVVKEVQPLGSYFDRMFFGGPAGAPTRAFYRPLVTLSFALDWRIWGGDPLGFHLTNLALHLACVALVFAIARRLGAAPVAAAVCAAGFGLLPRLTEAVAWISGRTDVLAACFVLAALAVHRPSAGRRWAAAALLLLGLLSKEVAVAGLLAILALEAVDARGREARGWLRRLLPPAAAGGVYAFLRLHAELAARAPSRAPRLELGQRLLLSLEAAGSYLWMSLDALRPRTQIGSIHVRSWPLVALGALALVGLALAAWRWKREFSRSAGAAGIAASLILVPLALVLHLVPLPLKVAAADRFLYMPAAGLAIGLAAWTSRWPPTANRLAAGFALVFLPAAGLSAYARVPDWRDEVSLWSEAAAHAPEGNSLPFVQLGIALSRVDRPEEALPALERAEAIDGDLARRGLADPMGSGSREARAFALAAMGRFGEARSIFEGLAKARPSEPEYRYNLGVVRTMALDFEGASAELERLIERYPDHREARALLEEIGEVRAAWTSLPPDASGDDPGTAMRRAGLLARIGRQRDAARIWRSVAADEGADRPLREEAARRLSLLPSAR